MVRFSGHVPPESGRVHFHGYVFVMSTSKSRSDVDLYAEAATACACNNFRKASRAVTQLFDQTLEPSGLRSTQFVILLEIVVAGTSTVPLLAKRLVMDRSTLQRNIQPLVKRKLIKVGPAISKARRSRSLTLTPSGRRAVKEAAPLWKRAQSTFVQQLGDDRWSVLLENLPAAVTAARADSVPSAD